MNVEHHYLKSQYWISKCADQSIRVYKRKMNNK